ncbi:MULTISPECIES: thioesterase II family protein [unclassified Streptosporangium]|uniref:thioesterase II family protein n=1 Tax=unclassified Streptosporangium TaxID=2632669 RepID=UPI002E29002A|nr:MULTISPECIES: alpha/beta fold hydrolase [unclassified Streptosporangium]
MTWLRCAFPRPGATTRLFCLAHAGGSANAYRAWSELLPASVELHATQLPGRADRFTEPLPDDMDALADEVTGSMLPLLDRRFALFGHSMGATLAYEVTRRLEARGIAPAQLFVSGARAPHDPRDRPAISEYDDDRFVAELARLGGTEVEILSHRAMRELVLPYVRADFRLVEAYRHRPGPPLHTPISALVGDADPVVTPVQAKSWEALTSSGFSLTVFPGDHFYLQPRRAPVVEEIARTLMG